MPYRTEKILINFRATIMLCDMLIDSKQANVMYVVFLSHTVWETDN